MRILHINKFFYRRGGAEAYMLEVAELQEETGHQVAFFAMDHPDNLPSPHARHFPAHLEMNPLPPGLGGKLAGAGRMMWSTSARRGLDQVIADFRPHVAHLHNIYHQLSPSVLAALREAGVPAVMTLHDYKLACPSYNFLSHGRTCTACVHGGLWQAVARRCKGGSRAASAAVAAETWLHRRFGAYDHVGAFICPSRFLSDTLADAGVYPNRLVVLDHFVHPVRPVRTVRPARSHRAGGTPSAPSVPAVPGRLVIAGRLSAEKGIDTAIRAMDLLQESVTLEIAGDGPERSALQRLASELVPGRVTFHGRLPRGEVMDLLGSALALLVPSRWYENQPMTILEAFGSGVPVIASDLGGMPELVRPGRTGRLVPPDRPIALAEAVAGLIADPHGTQTMGAYARSLAAERFDPAQHLTKLLDIYASVGATTGAVAGTGPHRPDSNPAQG